MGRRGGQRKQAEGRAQGLRASRGEEGPGMKQHPTWAGDGMQPGGKLGTTTSTQAGCPFGLLFDPCWGRTTKGWQL